LLTDYPTINLGPGLSPASTERRIIMASFIKIGREVPDPVQSNPLRTVQKVQDCWNTLVKTSSWYEPDKECMVAFLLDGRNRVKHVSLISIGTLTSSLVHPREVFRPAILAAASQIILAHQHPTNELDPSPEDISITRRLREAGQLLGITILDHLIFGPDNDSYFSFAEEGIWNVSRIQDHAGNDQQAVRGSPESS